jgi:acetylornithine deacetylase/succinyl-diaminopimelate desuccinylase-like protein
MTIKTKIFNNTDRYIRELSDFLSIPSISTDPVYEPEIRKAANLLVDNFTTLKASSVQIHETIGHPIVTAQFGHDILKPTVLVYGHYDVQPPGDLEKWVTPPFEPNVRDGKIYARGATDDKGQVFPYLKAIELMQERGSLQCNIRFLIEGSEEISSKGLSEFLEENLEITKCDAAVISDTAIIDEDTPSLTVGLRGHTRVRVTVKGPDHDVHSGIYGGAIANPLEALTKMVSTITDKDGLITLPCFYDNIRNYTDEERKIINSRDMDEVVKKDTGATSLVGEKNYTTLERIGTRPAFTILSIHGGPAPTNLMGVISSEAIAMLAVRTVPGQDPVGVGNSLVKHLHDHAPDGVSVNTEMLGASSPWSMESFEDPSYKAASKAYAQVWGKDTLTEFCGGSIPVVEMLQKLGISPTLMGFGLESDGLHSPNEHFSINRMQKSIETIINYFDNFAETFKESGFVPIEQYKL